MVATINTPAFAVTKSADQTISDVTLTTITFEPKIVISKFNVEKIS